MHPVLFKIGAFELYSYGLMMALGVLTGLFIVDREAKRYGYNRDSMVRLVAFTFLVGLLGSRIVYVFTLIGNPTVDWLEALFHLRAGFVYYGGLISSWLFLVWYLNHYRMPFWPVLDAFAMAICLGLAVGRLGCLLGGCCFGIPTKMPWGVVLVNESALGALHPAPLYESLILVCIFLICWLRRRKKAYEGELVVWFVGSYAIARFILEYWRGDIIRGYVIDEFLTTSQFLSIPMLALAALLHVKLRKKMST